MNNLFELAGTLFDLLLVILGFGFIIFVHELGHFMAARWAGIRVLAFAIGFGPAALSYRKGMGWRRGSSEPEYLDRMRKHRLGEDAAAATISPTEYRFNWLPFGGYVKMLGQDDANPMAVSDEPDSYQRCKPWKRMVVISAGVVMNLILAATLFVGVFMYGLKSEPAKVGSVGPGSPASRAVAIGDVVRPGLMAGDVITSINGRKPNSFNDLILATAMTARGDILKLTVDRKGTEGLIDFAVTPETGTASGLQEIGVSPSRSNQILRVKNESQRKVARELLEKRGLIGVEPGMFLTSVGGRPVESAADAEAAIGLSRGEPVEAVFQGDEGNRVAVSIKPQPELQSGIVAVNEKTRVPVTHVLGLTPIVAVAPASELTPNRQGLQDGDLFVRIGAAEFPGVADGVAEIRSHTGKEIPITVLRLQPDGSRKLVKLEPPPRVNGEGRIGFGIHESTEIAMVALPPPRIIDSRHAGKGAPPPASSLVRRPGTRIASIAGQDVASFADFREALQNATRDSYRSGLQSATVKVAMLPPALPGGEEGAVETVDWVLSSDDLAALHSLSWTTPAFDLLEPEQFMLKAKSPLDALRMGMAETKRVMISTYLTFARLFQGTVKVEHLKGPVGIAHLGTRVAEKGIVWLLFFMALISVNLAVINFLPLPIVDGGQFLFLLVEQFRGKPVPLAIQNVATIAGLLLIGTVFVIVTFHDISNLF